MHFRGIIFLSFHEILYQYHLHFPNILTQFHRSIFKFNLFNVKKGTNLMSDFKVETKCLHSGYTPSKGEPCALPIYQSTTYKYDTTDEMGQLFDLKAEGYSQNR